MAQGRQDHLDQHASGAGRLHQRQPRLCQATEQDRRVRRARKRHPYVVACTVLLRPVKFYVLAKRSAKNGFLCLVVGWLG